MGHALWTAVFNYERAAKKQVMTKVKQSVRKYHIDDFLAKRKSFGIFQIRAQHLKTHHNILILCKGYIDDPIEKKGKIFANGVVEYRTALSHYPSSVGYHSHCMALMVLNRLMKWHWCQKFRVEGSVHFQSSLWWILVCSLIINMDIGYSSFEKHSLDLTNTMNRAPTYIYNQFRFLCIIWCRTITQ